MRLVKIPDTTPKKPKKRHIVAKLLVAMLPVVLAVNTLRPLPDARVELYSLKHTNNTAGVVPAWPTNATQSALGAEGFGLLDTYGAQTPIATASIAKVITALCVLQKHPLKLGEKGPVIRITESDYALYQAQLSGNGSNLPVYIGEEIDLYTAIQALMIPSANNMADTLASWAFGDMDTYHTYANTYVRNLGMVNTTITGNASGYDIGTKSTAQDLVKLGLTALQNDVLMEIAGQTEANFPFAGRLQNYNKALGREGIDGLKTGNNLENLGGLLFTQTTTIDGKKLRLVGAVLGASDLPEALAEAERLAGSTARLFPKLELGAKPVGIAKTAWGATASLSESRAQTLMHYVGSPVVRKVNLSPNTAMKNGESFGTVTYQAGSKETSSQLVVSEPAPGPSLWWRASRSFW